MLHLLKCTDNSITFRMATFKWHAFKALWHHFSHGFSQIISGSCGFLSVLRVLWRPAISLPELLFSERFNNQSPGKSGKCSPVGGIAEGFPDNAQHH